MRRRKNDRGSVFIQFALLVPILTVFAMGIVEYGIGWKWANDVNAAARDAGRTATSEPIFLTSDRSALQAIGSSFSAEQIDNIERIVIYTSSTAAGTVPAACKNLTPSTGSPGSRVGVNNSCNVYGKAQVNYALANPTVDGPWINSTGTGCDTSDIDSYWCPATRRRSLTTGSFDYIGVYIVVKKPSITNIGFGQMTIHRTAVFRLEPSFGG